MASNEGPTPEGSYLKSSDDDINWDTVENIENSFNMHDSDDIDWNYVENVEQDFNAPNFYIGPEITARYLSNHYSTYPDWCPVELTYEVHKLRVLNHQFGIGMNVADRIYRVLDDANRHSDVIAGSAYIDSIEFLPLPNTEISYWFSRDELNHTIHPASSFRLISKWMSPPQPSKLCLQCPFVDSFYQNEQNPKLIFPSYKNNESGETIYYLQETNFTINGERLRNDILPFFYNSCDTCFLLNGIDDTISLNIVYLRFGRSGNYGRKIGERYEQFRGWQNLTLKQPIRRSHHKHTPN